MTHDDILREFTDASAILKGHFLLSSGLHSDTYVQCARALMDPQRAGRLCKLLADNVRKTVDINGITRVVSPAMGGVIVGYETARQLGKESIFCERVDGVFTLRRGFELSPQDKVLIVEDVVTTGKSSLETVACIQAHGAQVVAEACLINRNGAHNPLAPLPLISLLEMQVATYTPDQLPEALKPLPAVKPGSRHLSAKK